MQSKAQMCQNGTTNRRQNSAYMYAIIRRKISGWLRTESAARLMHNGWMEGRKDGRKDGWMDVRMEGWMKRWMERWMEGRIDE